MADLTVCLAVLEGMAVYYYGLRALVTAFVSAAACMICDAVCKKLRGLESDSRDISPFITGLTLALMMPVSVPYYILITAAIFAEVISKHAFGGLGCEIFSGAAAGYAFTEICFTRSVLAYPAPHEYVPVSGAEDAVLHQSLSKTMLNATSSGVSDYELLLGKFVSPMGTGVIILLIAVCIYLIVRRSVSVTVFASQAAVYGIFSFIFGGFEISAVKYAFVCGMFLFGSAFITSVTGFVPKSFPARIIYGILLGLLICLFRFYAYAENPIIYAALIAAPIRFYLDRVFAKKETDGSDLKAAE